MRERVLILGAAGRDFHDFLVFFKRRPRYEVVGFTAAQIPGIAGRRFPASLAGRRYPRGIAIYPEERLERLIAELGVDTVCLAYSDLSNQEVMERASRTAAAGANFLLLGPPATWVEARVPVIAVTAVRTGAGKSQVARAVAAAMAQRGRRVVAVRHAMPYGRDLARQASQRFATAADLGRHHVTIEEAEEYRPWIEHGFVVHAGFDYRAILRHAEREADLVIFDGGNNDFPLVRPDVQITIADPLRAGHEETYFHGNVNLRRADIVVINKIDSAEPADIERVALATRRVNPHADLVFARSELEVDDDSLIRGRRCLVIGDGPTLTHGGMAYGAGTLAVRAFGGKVVDPRRWLEGDLARAFTRFGHLEREVPALGYSPAQIRELRRLLDRVPCDTIVDGSPADLAAMLRPRRPVARVRYELGAQATSALAGLLGRGRLARRLRRRSSVEE